MATKKVSKPAKSAPPRRAAPVEAPVRHNGKQTAAGPPPAPAENRAQYKAFERAMQYFHKHQFKEAKEWFGRAKDGPVREVTAKADQHVKMCERRLEGPGPAPRSAEENYTYGIAMLNAHNLPAARKHLEAALKLSPNSGHIHYAMAACLATSGDAETACQSLKRAIELDARSRMAARQDADFHAIARHPAFQRLVNPL
ncbi:MAG: TPR end-of-group domain-containing protein [Bryobacteraceae bacterium]